MRIHCRFADLNLLKTQEANLTGLTYCHFELEVVENGSVWSEGISIDDPLMVVVNDWFTPNRIESGCTDVASPDGDGWLNVDWVVVLSVACDNVWEADDCCDWESKVAIIMLVTGSFDWDVTLCNVEALSGLLLEVWIAEDDL